MQLFFNPTVEPHHSEIIFDKDESRHIVKVLRKRNKDTLHVTNGKGYLFITKIIRTEPGKCIAEIHNFQKENPKDYTLHLAVAPTKMNDRYEWFLEKATEIGVDTITPIICKHSERKIIKPARFERVLQSAMKQSLRYSLPKLEQPQPFSDFIENHNNKHLFIAHCEDSEKHPLKKSLLPKDSYTILIGPEGDFSSEEIKKATEKNYNSISLGNSRLRTETAAIVACHTVALLHE